MSLHFFLFSFQVLLELEFRVLWSSFPYHFRPSFLLDFYRCCPLSFKHSTNNLRGKALKHSSVSTKITHCSESLLSSRSGYMPQSTNASFEHDRTYDNEIPYPFGLHHPCVRLKLKQNAIRGETYTCLKKQMYAQVKPVT